MSVFSKVPGPCSKLLFCVALVSCSGGSKPEPVKDFSLTSTPASITLIPGGTGQQIGVNAVSANNFAGMVAVAIMGLPAGVTANPAKLNLTTGVAQSVSLTAALNAAMSTSTVTFVGTSGNLTHSAPIALTVQSAAITNAPDVTTYHYDISRDGLNAKEIILTPNNVNATQFGKIGFDMVDGKVDAEPLYLANVVVGSQLHNVLYVATEHDSVYAFDADNGAQIWRTSIIGSGETTSDNHRCSQISPEIGITSTPVIDPQAGGKRDYLYRRNEQGCKWQISSAVACSRYHHRGGDQRRPDGDYRKFSGVRRQQPERQCGL